MKRSIRSSASRRLARCSVPASTFVSTLKEVWNRTIRRQINDNAAELAHLVASLSASFSRHFSASRTSCDPEALLSLPERFRDPGARSSNVSQLHILDDLHWADESTLALLPALTSATETGSPKRVLGGEQVRGPQLQFISVLLFRPRRADRAYPQNRARCVPQNFFSGAADQEIK